MYSNLPAGTDASCGKHNIRKEEVYDYGKKEDHCRQLEENEKVFRLLGFAGYLKDWDGPSEGEKPTGYIVITCPANVNDEVDAGIVGQTMLLAATEAGFGGCFFGNVKRDELKTQLNIPSELKIVYVIAFGYPKEEVVLEDIPADGDIKYYRDENQVHHVPKKRIEDIVL